MLNGGVQPDLVRFQAKMKGMFSWQRIRLPWLVALALSIGYASAAAPGSTVTFNKDVAPLVYNHCASCHHPGGIGPFPLLTYNDVLKHQQQIVAVTERRYMPPWPPEAGFGDFAGDRRLTDAQIQLFAQWEKDGSPEGDPQARPTLPHFTTEWQMGTPDLIVQMPAPYKIKPSGSDVFRNFIIPTNLKETRYVNGIELRMNNTRVVHHANIVLDRNGSLRARDGKDGQPGFPGMDVVTEAAPNDFDPDSHFLFWKPGTILHRTADALSWRLDPGTDLVVNLHLQPTGKAENIQAEVGIYFAKDPPTKFPILVQLEDDGAINIPPGDKTFSVADHITLPVSSDLLAIYPHAHYLGKLIEAWAVLPSGERRQLIRIPDWDINWQAVYEYRQPILLPAGTTVHMRVSYDNSSGNPRNPHSPPQRVRSGDRSEDEMGHVWLQLLPLQSADGRIAIEEAVMRRRLEKYPADFLAHYNLGSLLQLNGQLPEAIACYKDALKTEPDNVTAVNSLAGAYMQDNQIAQAIPLLTQALRADPNYLNARYNLARALAVSGDLDGSAAAYKAFLDRKQDDAAAQAGLGTILFKQRNYTEALPHFREAARLNPQDADIEANLGSVLAITGDLPGAIAAFERALQIDPTHQVARANLQRARAAVMK